MDKTYTKFSSLFPQNLSTPSRDPLQKFKVTKCKTEN